MNDPQAEEIYQRALAIAEANYGMLKFAFSIEEIFFIKNIEKHILTGTVQKGIVHRGDGVTLDSGPEQIIVVVETIEMINASGLTQASKGEQVGLRVRKVDSKLVKSGDFVFAK
ncbi:MAG: hypothetical protein K2X93_01045 [Candidatus Obscuribacterales bacterium]|nr:hypothetical protein [Candidatus Obscuribacterales bacterium]